MSTDNNQNDPTISFESDSTGENTHIVVSREETSITLTTIANAEFSKLDEDTLKTSFEACVTAIRSHDAFPRALCPEQRLANHYVSPNSQEIIEKFGLKTGKPSLVA